MSDHCSDDVPREPSIDRRVVVVRDRYVPSHPHARVGDAGVLGTGDVLTRGFSSDAQFAAYAPASAKPARLSHASLPLLAAPPRMQLFVVDVDPPDHVATGQWRDDVQARAAHLPGNPFGFWTRNGARIVWTLEEVELESGAAWSEWYLFQLVVIAAVTGIVADPTCSDWTRLHRAPHATRDGEMLTRGWLSGHPGVLADWQPPSLTDLERAAALGYLTARSASWRRVAPRLIEPSPSTPDAPNVASMQDARAPLAWARRRLAEAERGMRNRTLYDVARWLRGKAPDDDVRSELHAAARRVGLSDSEIRQTLKSALAPPAQHAPQGAA